MTERGFGGSLFERIGDAATLSDLKANGGIDTPFMDLPPVYADPQDDETSLADMAQKHLAVTPLLRGLGSSLSVQNSQDADAFLEESGRALQAAIQGLLDLQHSQNSLSDKHLRPLEDTQHVRRGGLMVLPGFANEFWPALVITHVRRYNASSPDSSGKKSRYAGWSVHATQICPAQVPLMLLAVATQLPE